MLPSWLLTILDFDLEFMKTWFQKETGQPNARVEVFNHETGQNMSLWTPKVGTP